MDLSFSGWFYLGKRILQKIQSTVT